MQSALPWLRRSHQKGLHVQLQVGCNVSDQRSRDYPDLLNIAENQGMLADQIDGARDSTAVRINKLYRLRREDRLGGAGDPQPLHNIFARLFSRE